MSLLEKFFLRLEHSKILFRQELCGARENFTRIKASMAVLKELEIEKKSTNPIVGYVIRWIAKCSHLQANIQPQIAPPLESSYKTELDEANKTIKY
jgi:hypothetical protein